MLIITNRNINKSNFKNGVGDHNAFGERSNAKGTNEVRIAEANKVAGNWKVELIKEPSVITDNNISSKKEFIKLRERLTTNKTNCVFFVHGSNQSFEKNLEKSLLFEKKYGVEVIVFSWPSNPGGFKTKEYRYAKRAAKASLGALDATLEKLSRYLKEPFNKEALVACDIKFSLLTYSMGNYLFQQYVNDVQYENETAIFDNVILCQADVDNKGHNTWVDLIETGKRVYVTINENDWVLKWSDANFQVYSLGRTAKNLNAKNAIYFDFTDGPNVGKTHCIFNDETNPIVKEFFSRALNGLRGEDVEGMSYHSHANCYRF